MRDRVLIDLELQQQPVGADRDRVALLDQRDQAALVGFRGDVAHDHAARQTLHFAPCTGAEP